MAPWIALWYWTKNEDNYWESLEIKLTCSGFFFVTITPWLIFIFFFIIMKFTVNKRLAVWSRLVSYSLAHTTLSGAQLVEGSLSCQKFYQVISVLETQVFLTSVYARHG